ncbi:Ankyrin-2 [Pseudocyphellaria aurata]|nr:Ankyrin-2 [Pseudocyphellaria aurata]
MAESSATGEAKLPKSRGESDQSGSGPRHRTKFKSFLKNTFHPASLKSPSTSGLNAALPKRSDVGDERIRSLASGEPETSSDAKCDPSKAQASHSPTPRNDIAPPSAAGDLEGVPIAELWNHAYELLREKEPKLIRKYEEEVSLHVSTMVGSTVVMSGLGKVRRQEQMEALVKQKLKEDEDGKWRIPLGEDRIPIRDLAGKVVSIVAWGKDFVGDALKSSPLCGIYEGVYHRQYEINRDGPSDKVQSLASKKALRELYLSILRFQAQSVCQFSRGLVSGGARSMFKMDDWDALLEDIKLHEAGCQKFFDLVKDQEALNAREELHKHRTSLLLDKLEELSLGIKGVRDKLEEKFFSDEQSKCFETLRTSNYLARKDLNPNRLAGTCDWFFEHPTYKHWLAQTSPSRLLWVSANPGCGKSVLAKALVDQYDRGSVCYYFFKDDSPITRSVAHAVCAILHQICDLRPDLISHILPIYRRNGAKLIDLFEDLWSAFVDIINDKDFGNVICILDAIDECSDDDYKKLLQRLVTIATSSTSIKILITSRPYVSIEIALFRNTGLDKNEIRLSGEAGAEQSMIEEDVSSFVTSKVQDFQRLRESTDIYDNAHEKLQTRLDHVKNRTYLWVSAVFDELDREVCAPEHTLLETIDALPESVDKAYEKILEKCSKLKRKKLIRVLHIMLAASRPLSLTEMNIALSIQDTSSGPTHTSENSFGKYLRDICGFFVNIIDSKLYFAHQTAREFLEGEDSYSATGRWRHSFQLADSHSIIALTCIDYLLLLYEGYPDASFETYATFGWPAHCQSIEVDKALANKVKSFLFESDEVAPSFLEWNTRAKILRPCSEHMDYRYIMNCTNGPPPTPFFLACNFGWLSVLNFLKTFPSTDWNQQGTLRQTGLFFAASEGHLDTVRFLLNVGANVGDDIWGTETPLYRAASNGDFEVVRLLLNARANVNQKTFGFSESPLHSAVCNGHVETTEVLLTAGADLNIQDHRKSTALHKAVEFESLEIVKLLLRAGSDVKIQDREKSTALHSAVSRGNSEIVKLLFMAGSDVNIQDDRKSTALHLAVSPRSGSRGQVEVVKLLLTPRADLNIDLDIQDRRNSTALHLAVSKGHLEIVQLLLTAGANPNIENDKGTALHLAVSDGYLEIVKVLLRVESDVNIQGDKNSTALHLAVERGHFEIIQLLLTAGANLNIQDEKKSTALHLAVSREQIAIVKLLLTLRVDLTIDLNIQDCRKSTAMHLAVERGHFAIVQLLLTADADLNIKNWEGTALHLAVSEGYLEIVQLLLTAGANPNIEKDEGTALHLAVSEGYLEIVKLLLTPRANLNIDLDIQDRRKSTALHLAVSDENLEMVKLLLKAGADVNIQNRRKSTALHSAVLCGNLKIVKLLLRAGADLNIQNRRNSTVLHLAVLRPKSSGKIEMVKLLLTAGADLNMENVEGTALQIAKDRNDVEIVKVLQTAGAIDSKASSSSKFVESSSTKPVEAQIDKSSAVFKTRAELRQAFPFMYD